jgi:hypothetical protein
MKRAPCATTYPPAQTAIDRSTNRALFHHGDINQDG